MYELKSSPRTHFDVLQTENTIMASYVTDVQ